jgi:hypothetical protein
MSAVTEATTQVARKPHRCTWCWQLIGAGETYTRYRYYGSDADAGTVKAHPECYEAIQDAASEEGGMIEWTPGQERPAALSQRVEGGKA